MGIRRIEDALRVETRKRSKMYIFHCVTPECPNEVCFQRNEFNNPRRTGMCKSCRCTKSWSKARRPYERIFNNLKAQAVKNQRTVELTFEEFLEFTKISECEYCQTGIVWVARGTTGRCNLDRKENDQGYSRANCVVCCWDCNRVKAGRYSYEEMKIIGVVLRRLRIGRQEDL